MIEVKNLIKKFNGFTAVDSVSFSVEKGEIFAFLGPNGAGKTTTIRMLTTLLKPTSGSIKINGFEVLNRLKSDAQTRDIPVIILTNLEKNEDIEKVLTLGATTYLLKANYTLDEIITKINQVFASK